MVSRGCAGASALALAIAATIALTGCGGGTRGGSFTSNDPLLNKIWADSVKTAADMIVRGPLTTDALDRPCAIDLHTVIIDGAVRDRCPYVGDEAVIGLTLDVSSPNWQVQRGMLEWFAAHQHPDGAIPASPLLNGDVVLIDYNAYWIQALYNYVLYSGDVGLAQQLWPNLVKLLDLYYPAHTRGGLLVNDANAGDYAFLRDGEVVAYYNAQYALALQLARTLAVWTGNTKHVAQWTGRRRDLSRAFGHAFWDASVGAFRDTTQDSTTHPEDAQAFAILAGLATARESKSALSYLDRHEWRSYGNTVTDSDAWDNRLIGSDVKDRVFPFISYFEVQSRYAARADASAFDLIRREWGYMAQNGSRSTMWETIGPYGGGPASFYPSWDSGWSSGAAPALTNEVLGVQPTSPGYATFTVNPHPGDLVWARGSVVTPHGLLKVSWKLHADGTVRRSVAAPTGTRWTNPSASK